MLNRVNKLLIGKDIARDASIASAQSVHDIVQNAEDGEVIVLDKQKKVLAPGSTIADTDTIFIAQATSKTFDFTNEAGTAVTGARELIFSDGIQGAGVTSYTAEPYQAKAEQTCTIVLAAVPTLGVEYVMRFVYTDMEEHPGQFTQTYRYTALAVDVANIDVFADNLMDKVNAHAGRRINATVAAGSDSLIFTAREIPESCTALTDIDEFKQVTFKAYFNYVDADGNWAPVVVTSQTDVQAVPGSGNWEQIRDLEKAQFAYRGVSNFTQFPVIHPAWCTVVDSYYDLIVIEHNKSYLSPGINSYQSTPVTLMIALATASTGINASTQKDQILSVLNPWMASCPGAFAGITI